MSAYLHFNVYNTHFIRPLKLSEMQAKWIADNAIFFLAQNYALYYHYLSIYFKRRFGEW